MSIEWRQIVDCPGFEVSSCGDIRDNGNIKNSSHAHSGYRSILLKDKDGLWIRQYVHRIVANAFLPNDKNYDLVDHINNNRADNRAVNLRWATRSENSINVPTRAKHRNIYTSSPTRHTVKIMRKGRFVLVKSFPTIEEAVAARDAFLGNNTV
jgi:hypothetical protein